MLCVMVGRRMLMRRVDNGHSASASVPSTHCRPSQSIPIQNKFSSLVICKVVPAPVYVGVLVAGAVRYSFTAWYEHTELKPTRITTHSSETIINRSHISPWPVIGAHHRQ